ncbi:MAG: translation initiation factor IF-1 [Parcubacteria group bacterium]|nr:translation initiation factor IF-1 [Parcubacteria group bacterium]MCR4342972.1 translation initiation factor IF-1 [Patescibacteria group bacterium]
MTENKEQDQLVRGTAIEALPNATFRIRLEDGREIIAYLSGKMRIHRIKVLVGDSVGIEMNSPTDTKGRIKKRF